jgi:hypothetical protein
MTMFAQGRMHVQNRNQVGRRHRMIGATLSTAGHAADLIISTGLGKPHPWVGAHMDPFADAMEKESTAVRQIYPLLCRRADVRVGSELDALTSGTIAVAAPSAGPLSRRSLSAVGRDSAPGLWHGLADGHPRLPEDARFRRRAEGRQDVLPV